MAEHPLVDEAVRDLWDESDRGVRRVGRARALYLHALEGPYDGKPTPVESVIYKSVFESWLEPRNASLAMAFATVLVWFAILAWMYRKKIFLKV